MTQQLSGISFLDNLLPRQVRPNGVHAILGPSGVGTSKLAMMIAARGAWNCHFHGGGYYVFAANESTIAQLRGHALSYLGGVRLESMQRGELVPIHADDGLDSYELAKAVLESGRLGFKSASQVNTLRPLADQLLDSREVDGRPLSGIVIDDVTTLATRHALATQDIERNVLDQFLQKCQRFARDFNCPVWVCLHLSGAVWTRHHRAELSHADAGHHKSIQQYIETAFVLGNHADGLFMIRNTYPSGPVDVSRVAVVRIAGGGATIEEVNDEERQKFLEGCVRPKVLEGHGVMRAIEAYQSRKSVRAPDQPQAEHVTISQHVVEQGAESVEAGTEVRESVDEMRFKL